MLLKVALNTINQTKPKLITDENILNVSSNQKRKLE